MGGGNSVGLISHHMKVIICLAENMDKEGLFFPQEITIKGTGLMENKMEKGYFIVTTQMSSKMDNGKMAVMLVQKNQEDKIDYALLYLKNKYT